MVGHSSKEAADWVEKLAVPVQCDREGLISCTGALMTLSEDCNLESHHPTPADGLIDPVGWHGRGR